MFYAEVLVCGMAIVQRIRKHFATVGVQATLAHEALDRQLMGPLDGRVEPHLRALASSEAPAGRERWMLRLLADKLVKLGQVNVVSYETIHRVLKKMPSSRGCTTYSPPTSKTMGQGLPKMQNSG